MTWRNALDTLASWVFPVRCEACEAPLAPEEPGVCPSCRNRTRPLEKPLCSRCARPLDAEPGCADCAGAERHFDAAVAAGAYEGTLRSLVHAYKFKGRTRLAGYLSESLADAVRGRRFDAVVGMPLDPAKKRKRGFNQSGLLAARLAGSLKLPDLSSGIARGASPAPQASLGRRERRGNVAGRFRARRGFEGMDLLLVDDVLTTGETASECAGELKRAGARSVTVAVCARAVS